MKIDFDRNENKINYVAITDDTLSNRGGLSLIMRYLDKTGIPAMVEDRFSHLRRSTIGETIGEFARQSMAFFFDGTKQAIARFDDLKNIPLMRHFLNAIRSLNIKIMPWQWRKTVSVLQSH